VCYNERQLVEKLRCILSLPNLFPSLARLFPFRTLWAYGFDRAAPRAPEKLRLVKVNRYFTTLIWQI